MARETHLIISGKTVFYIVVALLCLTLPLFLLTKLYFVPFALVLGAGCMALIFYNPFLGLLAYTFIFLIRPQEWIGILQRVPMPMERPLALLLIVSVLLRSALTGQNRFKLRSVDISTLVYLGVVFLSVIFAIRVEESWLQWEDLAKLVIFHFLVAATIRTRKEFKWYLLYIIALTAFYSFWSVQGYYQGIRQWRMGIDRAVGPDTSYGGPNSLAMTLVSTIPLVYYYITKETPGWLKAGIYGIVGLMLWNIILTGSRTGMGGALVFFGLLMWQSKYKARMIVAGVVALACIWFVMPDQYKLRFESTTELTPIEGDRSGTSMSASARIKGIEIGLRMLADRPVLGYGIGNWGYTSGTFYEPGWWGNAHTIIGQIFGEIGLLGTAAFIMWVYVLFRALTKLRRYYREKPDPFMANTALALRTMLILLLVLGLGGHNLFRYSWFLISALAVTMIKLQAMETEAPVESHQELTPSTTQV